MEFTLAKQKVVQTPELSKIYFNPSNQHFNQGLVIMSEFMSSARVMRGAVTVNPWKLDEVCLMIIIMYLHNNDIACFKISFFPI